MLDFIFTQHAIISIIISGFLGISFSTLLLQAKKKIPTFGPRPRKRLGRVLALGSALCGILLFSLAIIGIWYYHQDHFNSWLTGFVLSTIVCTIVFTFIAYIAAYIMLKRLDSLRN